MGDNSGIEWTDATWNPVVGCSLVSPGCTHCYAQVMAHRIKKMEEARHGRPDSSHYFGTTKAVNGKPVWTGVVKPAPEHIFEQPLRWLKPRRIFVNSMSDLFHEGIPDSEIDKVFAVMAMCPQHTFQVLTKRSKRMRQYLGAMSGSMRACRPRIYNVADEICDQRKVPRTYSVEWPLPNVWLGVSCEDQERADERVPDLLETPAAIRFVSAEPLLGPINFKRITVRDLGWQDVLNGYRDCRPYEGREEVLDWVIVGGESGPGARPMETSWAENIMLQCRGSDTAFFMKQMWGPVKSKMPPIPPHLNHQEVPTGPGDQP